MTTAASGDCAARGPMTTDQLWPDVYGRCTTCCAIRAHADMLREDDRPDVEFCSKGCLNWWRADQRGEAPNDESTAPNCPLVTGQRPCECDLPRCPVCNYTEHDARFERDHHLCRGVIPHPPAQEPTP